MMAARWRWGVPDWRNEDEYPADMKLHEWLWQFCRRRHDYREAWLLGARKALDDHLGFVKYMNDTGEEMASSWTSLEGYMFHDPEAEKLFRLHYIRDPAEPKPTRGLFAARYGDSFGWSDIELTEEEQRQGVYRVTFNLNEPINDQIKRARELLLEMQEEHLGNAVKDRRLHTGKWSTYLRVLDARDDGQTWEVISREILRYTRNEPQAARQVWEQAQRLMFNFPW